MSFSRFKYLKESFYFLFFLSGHAALSETSLIRPMHPYPFMPAFPGAIACKIQKKLNNETVRTLAEGVLEVDFTTESTGISKSYSGFDLLIPDMEKDDFVYFRVRFHDRQHPERGYEKDYSPRVVVETARKGSDSHLSYKTYFYPENLVQDRFDFVYPIELDPSYIVQCRTFVDPLFSQEVCK